MIAKTKQAERQLKGSFATRRDCHKRYRALLLGKLEPPTGIVNLPIDGCPATTRYSVINYHPCKFERSGFITVVDLFPQTGRRHQLRKHMKSLRHPIFGDRRYSGLILEDDTKEQGTKQGEIVEDTMKSTLSSLMSRLCLWAVELTLPHPVTNEKQTFAIKDPDWLDHVIRQSAPDTKT